ncbi:hypothetical protein ABH930_001062 [Kitasatospora sp. GAS204A]|uniref:hypothetical protein n=1 Tax=unclassified Kitasatospora TaxID=2633591 RepID=UPI0024756D12|nr:hypothetical protein [Kitasatospora sp. GAS204B]MDH6116663.1 hypothetical protein [Kitasatospora sp. GAS204B]
MAGQFPGQFGPVVPTAAKGPFGVGAKVLLCLVAVLTAGLLGFVPAVALAARRKRRVDVVGAVVFAALSLLMLVCAVIGGADKHAAVVNGLGEGTMALLVFAAPTHFLLMDRQVRVSVAPLVAWPLAPQPPAYQPPSAQAPAPVDELRQLGELLRRQAEDGGR